MEAENKKLNVDEDDYTGCLNENEENKLIKQFESLKFFDPKIDSLFKVIFGNYNNIDVAISLIKAVLPEEEEINNLTFHNLEIHTNSNFNPNEKGITVDINAEDTDHKNFYIIEMQIHEVPDILGRAELSTSRIFDSLYKKGDLVKLKEKIYSINFLYYDMFPADKDYYHHIFPHEYKKKNICIPFKNTIIIELKKFKEQFDESQINEELLNNEEQKRMVERQLWFALLSKINVLYHKPSTDPNSYYTIIRNIKNKKTGEIKEVKIYIKNEISKQLVEILVKVEPIKKALELCVNLSESEIDEYVSQVDDYTGLLTVVNSQKEEIEQKDQVIEQKDKEIEKLKNIINEYNKRNNNNEISNNDDNKRTRI